MSVEGANLNSFPLTSKWTRPGVMSCTCTCLLDGPVSGLAMLPSPDSEWTLAKSCSSYLLLVNCREQRSIRRSAASERTGDRNLSHYYWQSACAQNTQRIGWVLPTSWGLGAVHDAWGGMMPCSSRAGLSSASGLRFPSLHLTQKGVHLTSRTVLQEPTKKVVMIGRLGVATFREKR